MKLVAVDDEPLVLDVLVKAIRKAEAGCEVQGFVRSRDALAAVQDGLRPDAAFLDIEMAGMNGLELAMRIQPHKNHFCHRISPVCAGGIFHSCQGIPAKASHC